MAQEDYEMNVAIVTDSNSGIFEEEGKILGVHVIPMPVILEGKTYYEGIDLNKLPGYSQGGLVDFTGPVMVHGSKSKPEGFISAEDTALLKSTIFSSNNNVLRDFINALENRSNSNANIETAPNVVIEEVNLEIASGTIANDYDAKRAGEKILEEMVKISRKTTNRVSSRR